MAVGIQLRGHLMVKGLALKNAKIPFAVGSWEEPVELDDEIMLGTDWLHIVSGREYFVLCISEESKWVWVLFGGDMDRRVLLPRSWIAL